MKHPIRRAWSSVKCTANGKKEPKILLLRKQILQMQLWMSSLLISGSFLDEISNSGVDFGSQLQQRSVLNSLPLCVLPPWWSIIRILEVLTLTQLKPNVVNTDRSTEFVLPCHKVVTMVISLPSKPWYCSFSHYIYLFLHFICLERNLKAPCELMWMSPS